MNTNFHLHNRSHKLIAKVIRISQIIGLGLFDKVTKMKYDIPNNRLDMFDEYIKEIDEKLNSIE